MIIVYYVIVFRIIEWIEWWTINEVPMKKYQHKIMIKNFAILSWQFYFSSKLTCREIIAKFLTNLSCTSHYGKKRFVVP